MKIIMTTKDILDLMDDTDSEFMTKVKSVFESSVTAMVAGDEFKEKLRMLVETQVKNTVESSLRTNQYNKNLSGWAGKILEEEFRKQCQDISLTALVSEQIRTFFQQYARAALQDLFQKELAEKVDKKLTDTIIVTATEKVIRKRLTND